MVDKKTLFIQIDNTPAPVEAENDYIPLDCKQINDFCSFVGDALIGDLKDCNGTPLYRLINPAGRLLSDFEKVDKANYDLIIAQWLDVLDVILHKGVTQCDEQFTIRFPQQYTDWLLCNENDYYVEIGKSLLANDGNVYLDADGISEDIISALQMKINRFLNGNKDIIKYIVFSNERIGNSSNVVKCLKRIFDNYAFLRLEQWRRILSEEISTKTAKLEEYKSINYGPFRLGITKKSDFQLEGPELYSDLYFSRKYKCYLKFDDNNLCRYIRPFFISGTDKERMVYDNLMLQSLSSICGVIFDSICQPLSELVVLFALKGYIIIEPANTSYSKEMPSNGSPLWIHFYKETDTYVSQVNFYGVEMNSLKENRIQMVSLTDIELSLKQQINEL